MSNIIYDSLYDDVKALIQGSYLSNSDYQYTPSEQLWELPENTAYPKILAEASTGYVDGDEVGFTLRITILYIPPDIDVCKTKIEKERRINERKEFHTRTLIEVYRFMTGMQKKTDGNYFKEYNSRGRANIRRYRLGVEDNDPKYFGMKGVHVVEIEIPIHDSYVKICCPQLTPA